MQIYLGLGSNLGKRRHQLGIALKMLEERGINIDQRSPVVESPAALPANAPAEWSRPFLNLAVRCEVSCSPMEMLTLIEEIHSTMGRKNREPSCPRPIDIDILLWGKEQLENDGLIIPHPRLHKRNFVLTPLISMKPLLTVPGLGKKTLVDWSKELSHHIPLWMGILNVTPDSFSDGGKYLNWQDIEPHIEAMIAAGVHIIDIGGESTRPGAKPLTQKEAWLRISDILKKIMIKMQGNPLRPLISVDTYHPMVARKALELGADMINDESGLTSPEMIKLAKESGAEWVAMHQLTLPVDPEITISNDSRPEKLLHNWLGDRLDSWQSAGLDLNRIIFDPGIGFGKNHLQSLEILRHAGEFRDYGLRVLIGHSRKSFIKSFSINNDRDLFTVGASLSLCEQGVDIIRVHDVPSHTAAYLGWAHSVRKK